MPRAPLPRHPATRDLFCLGQQPPSGRGWCTSTLRAACYSDGAGPEVPSPAPAGSSRGFQLGRLWPGLRWVPACKARVLWGPISRLRFPAASTRMDGVKALGHRPHLLGVDVAAPRGLQQWGGPRSQVGNPRPLSARFLPSPLLKTHMSLEMNLSSSDPTGCRPRSMRSSVLRGTLTTRTWGDCSTCPRCGAGVDTSGQLWVVYRFRLAASLTH